MSSSRAGLHGSTPVLDVVLTSLGLTPRQDQHVLGIQAGDNVVEVVNLHNVIIVSLLGFVEHDVVDLFQSIRDSFLDIIVGDLELVSIHSSDSLDFLGSQISRSDLETDGDTLKLRGRISIASNKG